MLENKEELAQKFCEKTGYKFKKPELLFEALSHSSYANEMKMSKNNERLEFLGDSVLSLIVTSHIYLKHPKMDEGNMSRLRSSLVCDKSLAENSRKIGMGELLLMGKGEESSGGRNRISILENVFEAVTGAIYLDGGFMPARRFVLSFIPDNIEENSETISDYKTALQEVIQKNPDAKAEYVLIGEKGPAHDKEFSVEVRLDTKIIGTGSGKSKKMAEQQAAKQALERMKLQGK